MKTAADREAPAGTMARRRQREPCCSEVRPLTCSPAQSSSHLRASRPYISGDPNLKRKLLRTAGEYDRLAQRAVESVVLPAENPFAEMRDMRARSLLIYCARRPMAARGGCRIILPKQAQAETT
jgi:hypothetical protein